MNWKKWAPAGLAIALGLFAAMLARNMLSKPHPKAVAETKALQIVTATGPLMVGQEIKPENVTLVPLTTPTPPPAVFFNTADVVGKVLAASVIKGQNITVADLTPAGVAGLHSLIPPGMRAMTINIDEGNGQEGMLLPGNRIDILATVAAGKATVTKPIVSNVLIQATGVRLSSAKPEEGKEPGPYHTLTLIVSLRQAELLELATTSSRVRMLLRGSRKSADGDDDDEDGMEGATMADLTGPDSAATSPDVLTQGPTTKPSDNVVAVRAPKWTVEMLHGANSAPVKMDFDMPKPKPIMVDQKDLLDPAIPGNPIPDEKPER
jgi:pilus assembly protein CpaB